MMLLSPQNTKFRQDEWKVAVQPVVLVGKGIAKLLGGRHDKYLEIFHELPNDVLASFHHRQIGEKPCGV